MSAIPPRDIADLEKVCDRLDLFELVVAENGALIYRPANREERPAAVTRGLAVARPGGASVKLFR